MSATAKYTVDALGFIPRLWQIWRDDAFGMCRCIGVERLPRGGATVSVEFLPSAWKVKGKKQ